MESETFDDRYGLMGFPAQVRPTPSAVADANGTLWFATAGNLVSVDPRTLRFRVNPPTTYIQAVLVNGTTLLSQSESTSDRAENITRSSQLKNLEFDYVGLDFTSPERVVYRYKLDGEDKDWQDAGDRRQALYNKLAPGEYLFRVIASNGNGVWSEAATTRIKISPAFYQTSWFYLFCFALLVAALWVCYLLRLQYVTGRMRERMEARANERVRIARELHDTLLQSLHGLMLRFHFAVEALPEREPAREMLQGSLKRADLAIVEARERVQDLRNESAASKSLPETIESVARELRVDDSVNFSILVEGHPRDFHPPVKEELCRIAHEALTNSFHHSKASRIEVSLDYSFARFRMQCRDNGSGIEPSVLKDGGRDGHWGLIGMKERASTIGATLEIWSSAESGTEIGVTLPAPKAYAVAFRKGFWSRLLSDRRSLEE
jgi:two-component sensor histidine kinase